MKTRHLIPVVRELRFIAMITAGILFASLIGSSILMVMFNQELGTDFADAFFTMHTLYMKMNLFSILAVALQLALSAAIVFLVALRYSHRISGPMYRLRMILTDFQDGREVNGVTFRSGDFLKPLESLMTRMFDRINRQRLLEEEIRVLMTKESLADPAEKEAILKQLRHVADQLEGDNA
ncbi:MAG: hypothetical protein GXO70_09845 [Acidobacteria bacterium]|nr:hypothetical protein [Acidobacteriota bacterium]